MIKWILLATCIVHAIIGLLYKFEGDAANSAAAISMANLLLTAFVAVKLYERSET